MKKTLVGIVIGLGIAAGLYFLLRGGRASAGPNGGDIVALQDGTTSAELLANADTGELMVHTWDKDLKQPRPIKSESLTIGSGQQSVDLAPHPVASDPPGSCSRFYGQAEWLRGGKVHHGWLAGGANQSRSEFAWNNCWKGGQAHGAMWSEMGDHRRGMMGRGPDAGMRHE